MASPSSQFSFFSTLKTAWQLTRQHKNIIWIGFIVLIAINLIVRWVFGYCYNAFNSHTINFNNQIPLHLLVFYQLIAGFFSAPFYSGIIIAAVKICRNESVSLMSSFRTIRSSFSLAIAGMICALFAASANIVTFVFFQYLPIHNVFIPVITTTIYPLFIFSFLSLALPLMIEHQYNINHSFSLSIKVMSTHFNWFKVLLNYLFIYCLIAPMLGFIGYSLWTNQAILILLSTTIFIISLIWLVPYLFLFNAKAYDLLAKQYHTALAPNLKNG